MLHILCAIYTSTYFRSGLVFMKGLGAVPVGGPVLVRLGHSLVKWRILWIWCTLKFTNFLNQISGQPWIKTQRRKFRQTEIFNLKLWVKVLVIFGLWFVFKMVISKKKRCVKNFGESLFRGLQISGNHFSRIHSFGGSKIFVNHLKHKLLILENSLRSPKFYKNGREIITRNNLAFGLWVESGTHAI